MRWLCSWLPSRSFFVSTPIDSSSRTTRYTDPSLLSGELLMQRKTFAWAAASLALTSASLALPAQQPATLTVRADQPVYAVSPTLYGRMTEEINYSYDGGLYAEMVRNRTFSGDWSGVNFWYLVESGNSAAKMEVDRTTGPSDALKTSMRVDVDRADEQNQAGVLNIGYWGMAVKGDTEYKG